jgi:hypothetical protein
VNSSDGGIKMVEGLRIKPSFVGKDRDDERLFIERMGVEMRRMMEMGISIDELEEVELKRLKTELMGILDDK